MKTAELGAETINKIPLQKRDWGWILVMGVAFIVIGAFAFFMPVASTLGLTLATGALITASGIVHLVRAIKLGRKRGSVLRFLHSVVSVIAGAAMFFYPSIGMLALTLVLSFYFFVGAASQWILANAIRPKSGWVLGAVSALASFALGVYIILTFPISALWVPGILLGIDLTFGGVGMISLAMSARRLGTKGSSPAGRAERAA